MHTPLSEERLRRIEQAEFEEELRISSLASTFVDQDFVVLAIIRGWSVSTAKDMKVIMESAPGKCSSNKPRKSRINPSK